MPFTPFHFGPGLFAKSIAPDHFSFAAFVASQVAIDCETLYYLWRNEPPYHRMFHTFAGGTALGLFTAVVTLVIGRAALPHLPKLQEWLSRNGALSSEVAPAGAAIGGLVGGFTHALLDGMIHADGSRPLLPWSEANPLFGVVSAATMRLGCVLLGLIGLLILAVRRYREAAST